MSEQRMNPTMRVMDVSSCAMCPFYEQNASTFALDLFQKRKSRTGMCRHNGVGMRFPLGRFQIEDPGGAPPANCPLREMPIKIVFKS